MSSLVIYTRAWYNNNRFPRNGRVNWRTVSAEMCQTKIVHEPVTFPRLLSSASISSATFCTIVKFSLSHCGKGRTLSEARGSQRRGGGQWRSGLKSSRVVSSRRVKLAGHVAQYERWWIFTDKFLADTQKLFAWIRQKYEKGKWVVGGWGAAMTKGKEQWRNFLKF